MKFNELNLNPELLAGIEKLGFETPTDVQSEVIPFLLENKTDLIALAQTGTGKTAAFGLPILQQIDMSNRQIQALILCPTRELCVQIARDLKSFCSEMNALKVLAVYGGADIKPQLAELARGVQIVVATPGRMLDILDRRRADFSAVNRVVLDEADEMLNMGFEPELQGILSKVSQDAQTLLFSATMPRQVAKIASNYMENPHEITIGARNAPTAQVSHEVMVVHAKDRYNALRRVVDVSPGIYGIIFCRTKMDTQLVADRLGKDGYTAEALHGDLYQEERDLVMKKFRNRQIQLLVATDVAARGLDINDLTHVIHYAIPDDFNTYNHRSGRTGRAGKTGSSVAIIHMREHYKIERIEKSLGKSFDQKPIPTAAEISSVRLQNLSQRLSIQEPTCELVENNLEDMYSVLQELSKEELIRRIAVLDQGETLQHYQDSPELSTDPEKQKTKANPTTHRSAKEVRDAHVPRTMTTGMIELVVNVGTRNDLTAEQLKTLLTPSVPGAQVEIGRVNIVEMQTYFEVPYTDSADIVNHFAKHNTEFAGRPLNVALAGNAKPPESTSRKSSYRGKDNKQQRQNNQRPAGRKKYN